MAETATNYDPTVILVDTVAQIWTGLAVPSAGNRLTLHTDGTPESVANPNAVHLGHTREGAKITIVSSLAKHFADENAAPIKSTVEATEMMIEAELLQVLDADVLTKITAPFGSYSTASGYKQWTVGRKALTYDSIALIFPTPADVTKFAVAHIYNGINEAGLSYSISRKGMAGTPVKFVAHALTSRAEADSVGNYWFQIA